MFWLFEIAIGNPAKLPRKKRKEKEKKRKEKKRKEKKDRDLVEPLTGAASGTA